MNYLPRTPENDLLTCCGGSILVPLMSIDPEMGQVKRGYSGNDPPLGHSESRFGNQNLFFDFNNMKVSPEDKPLWG